jgi:uncharacterized spore protein YtfJ
MAFCVVKSSSLKMVAICSAKRQVVSELHDVISQKLVTAVRTSAPTCKDFISLSHSCNYMLAEVSE